MFDVIKSILGFLGGIFQNRRIIKVRVHKAVFLPISQEHYFVNVTNLSRQRNVTITHVWFDVENGQTINVLQPERPLPVSLSPNDPWETWISVNDLPIAMRLNAFKKARVRLSTGEVVKSKENKNVPAAGFIPGGKKNA